MSLRFVTGRPVSTITTQFLAWCCTRLQAQGKTSWLLIWDNASFHVSKMVRTWIREHNSQVKQEGKGVRILPFFLPTKSPWLNPIEPKWVHAKKAVNVAREWQTTHPKPSTEASPSGNPYSGPDPTVIGILAGIAIVVWLVISAVVASRRRENFFYTAFRLLGRFLLVLVVISRSTGRGSYSGRSGSAPRSGGFGSWGGGGSSPSSGGDV